MLEQQSQVDVLVVASSTSTSMVFLWIFCPIFNNLYWQPTCHLVANHHVVQTRTSLPSLNLHTREQARWTFLLLWMKQEEVAGYCSSSRNCWVLPIIFLNPLPLSLNFCTSIPDSMWCSDSDQAWPEEVSWPSYHPCCPWCVHGMTTVVIDQQDASTHVGKYVIDLYISDGEVPRLFGCSFGKNWIVCCLFCDKTTYFISGYDFCLACFCCPLEKN